MEFNKMIASLASYFSFRDDEDLTLVGTDSDFSAVAGYSPEEFENKLCMYMEG